MSDDTSRPGRGSGSSPMVGVQFSDVDASGDPGSFVRYLDRVAERVRDGKRAGYALLGLQPGDAVLDVGCGPGADVLELEAIVGSTGRAVGVDASATMIEEARKRAAAGAGRAEFEVAPAESLPFPDGTFAAVRTERVLMHVTDPAVAVRAPASDDSSAGCSSVPASST